MGIAALGAGALAWAAPAPAALAPPLARVLRIARRSSRPGTVALTFDDGPHPEGTPAVLEALADVPATFFLVGEQVRRDAGLAAEIVARGHAVAIHGHRHCDALRMPPRETARDLDLAAATIHGATGERPALHRAPLGIYSTALLAAVHARGWTPLLWSRWGRDWRRRATADSIATTATDGLQDGDVVLLHDADHYNAPGSWRATVAALPAVLEAIAARGLQPVALRASTDVAP